MFRGSTMKCSLVKIEELAQGNKVFVKTLVSTFIDQLPEAIENMNSYINQGDLEGLAREAHKLKPSLDLFSVESGMSLVRILEDYKSINSLEYGLEVHNELSIILSAVLESLRKELN